MAYIDCELFFMNDAAVSATMTSDAIDLGKGPVGHPLFIDVKLTKAMTSGSMSSIIVQSSSTSNFASAVDEVTITVPSSVVQTAPATLAQFFAPIRTDNRYVRLKLTGTSPVGGKVSAFMANGATVRL